MTGHPVFIARSIILTIFSPKTSPRDPPKTVKSCAKTHTGSAVDRAVAGQYPIAEGTILLLPEIVRAVPGQSVDLLERTLVEKRLNPLESGHLALGVLLVDRCLTLIGGVGAARLENLRFSGGGSALGAGWFSDLAWLCAHSPFLHRFVVPDH